MATPINKIKKQVTDSSDNAGELIDNVLKEVSATGEDCGSGQCPMPTKKSMADEPSMNSSDTYSSDNENLIKSAMKQGNGGDMVSSVEASEQAEKMIDQMLGANRGKKSLVEKIIEDIREPILVAVLFTIFNTGVVRDQLIKYLGKYLSSGDELNYFGMAAHAIVFGIAFYVIKKLLA